MFEQLRSIPIDKLNELKDAVSLELDRRVTQSVVAGKRVSFFSAKKARTITLQVTRINGQSLSGIEVDPLGNLCHHLKWRVGKSLVTPVT